MRTHRTNAAVPATYSKQAFSAIHRNHKTFAHTSCGLPVEHVERLQRVAVRDSMTEVLKAQSGTIHPLSTPSEPLLHLTGAILVSARLRSIAGIEMPLIRDAGQIPKT